MSNIVNDATQWIVLPQFSYYIFVCGCVYLLLMAMQEGHVNSNFASNEASHNGHREDQYIRLHV